jgi:hypothetical protein
MKLFFLTFLSLSVFSVAMASNEKAFKVQNLAKDCLKTYLNIEIDSGEAGFSQGSFETLSGENITKMYIKSRTKSTTIIYQMINDKPILLQITGTSETGGYTFTGLSHEGPNGCEEYRP